MENETCTKKDTCSFFDWRCTPGAFNCYTPSVKSNVTEQESATVSKTEIATLLGKHFSFDGCGNCSVSDVNELGKKLLQLAK
jgi:hypothetical protein